MFYLKFSWYCMYKYYAPRDLIDWTIFLARYPFVVIVTLIKALIHSKT